MAQVTLRSIDDGNRAAVTALRVAPDQEHFVATVAKSFEDATAHADANPTLRAIYAGDEPVGFVMLADPGDDHGSPRYYLWRLLIDADAQGRGYGRATLDALVAYLRTRPGADVLLTSCVPGEDSPQPFYERYGFVPTGEIKWDEVVLRLDLTTEDR